MNKSKIILAASFFSTALMVGALQTGPANAAPAVQPQTQIAKIVKADGIQLVRSRGDGGRHHGFRGHRGHRHGFHRPYRHGKFWRPGKWCKNHPYRCFRGYRHWGYRVGAGGALCHQHLSPTPAMAFHTNVRCGHRHYRAYRSWVWAR